MKLRTHLLGYHHLRPRTAATCLALAGFGWLVAHAVAQSPSSSPGLDKASSKDYVLTHTSSFNAPPTGSRNPFWPIGWVPSAPVAAAAAPTIDVKADQFVVTSISVDYPPLAVINGKTRGIGDRIPVSADATVFVTVKSIADQMVVLDYHGHELQAPLASGLGAAHKAGK